MKRSRSEAEQAIDREIAQWERLLNDPLAAPQPRELCALFNEDPCVGCPVYAETGVKYCDGTDYDILTALDAAKREKAEQGRIKPGTASAVCEIASKEIALLKIVRGKMRANREGQLRE